LSELLRGSLSGSASGLHLVIYGTIVVIVMLYFPSGISGAIARGSAWLWSRTKPAASPGMKNP
jgi:ABC-type branched-subunit amino acid transport system permease subunit